MTGREALFRSTCVYGTPSRSSSSTMAPTDTSPSVTTRTRRSTRGGGPAAPAGSIVTTAPVTRLKTATIARTADRIAGRKGRTDIGRTPHGDDTRLHRGGPPTSPEPAVGRDPSRPSGRPAQPRPMGLSGVAAVTQRDSAWRTLVDTPRVGTVTSLRGGRAAVGPAGWSDHPGMFNR